MWTQNLELLISVSVYFPKSCLVRRAGNSIEILAHEDR